MFASHSRAAFAGVLALTVALSTACGGSDEKTSANGLEESQITLGTMTVADTAPVQIALSKGLFKAEGLTVRTQVIQGGAAGIPLLKSGGSISASAITSRCSPPGPRTPASSRRSSRRDSGPRPRRTP
ncbi:ABC transporter substrate-binding protein [Actinomadura madurae]|uniref:ABC transporter substrate-binding protein n=1 Tax=Actinomadura madurae TaxID=1993 RepID=UPI0020D23139|nr:ABC transporter substrate-binding protein [Actinomadura madurae]MCQ0014360.1 ABC transporter substrate-binding protein [Actinomadura madurae]